MHSHTKSYKVIQRYRKLSVCPSVLPSVHPSVNFALIEMLTHLKMIQYSKRIYEDQVLIDTGPSLLNFLYSQRFDAKKKVVIFWKHFWAFRKFMPRIWIWQASIICKFGVQKYFWKIFVGRTYGRWYSFSMYFHIFCHN